MSTTLERIIQRRRPELKKKEKEVEKGVSWTRVLVVVAFVVVLLIVGIFLYYYWWKPQPSKEEDSILEDMKRMESSSKPFIVQDGVIGVEGFRGYYESKSKCDV